MVNNSVGQTRNTTVSRRKLLATAGVAFTGLSGLSGRTQASGSIQQGPDPAGPPGMKVGLATIANSPGYVTNSQPIDEVIRMAGDAGFYGLEIWGQDHIGDESTETLRAIRDTARRNELKIPVYGSYLTPGSDTFQSSVDEELRIAHDLGASKIRVWGGEQEYGDHTEEHFQRVVTDLQEVCDKAHERGMDVTVEKHEGALTVSAEGSRRLFQEVNRRNFGINWQPLFHLSESELINEAEELAPISNLVHLQTVAEQGDDNRTLLRDSYFDFEEILRVFHGAGYDGWIELEFTTDELDFQDAICNDINYLRSILKEFDPVDKKEE